MKNNKGDSHYVLDFRIFEHASSTQSSPNQPFKNYAAA